MRSATQRQRVEAPEPQYRDPGFTPVPGHPAPLPVLTGLRFLAAFLVLLAHCSESFIHFAGPEPAWRHYMSGLAALGMPLFFVLSGFVIHYNYFESIRTDRTRGTYNFFVARFARLYPLYFLILCLDLFRYGFFENLSDPAIAEKFFAAIPSYLLLWQTWLYQIIGDHSLAFTFPAMTQVTWSISTEWFFYFLYPLICYGFEKLRTVRAYLFMALAITLVGYASLYVADNTWSAINQFAVAQYGPVAGAAIADNFVRSPDSFVFWLFYLSPYPRVLEFGLGCATAGLFMCMQKRPIQTWELPVCRWGTAVAVLAIAVLFALSRDAESGLIPGAGVLKMYFGFAPFIALLLFCCARYRTAVSAFFSQNWIVLCGEASYSIYLLHIGIVQYVQIFDQLAKAPPAIPDFWGTLHALVAVVIVAAIVIGASFVTYAIIEVPTRRWLRQLLSVARRPTLVAVEPRRALSG